MNTLYETEFFAPDKCSRKVGQPKWICFLYEDCYNVQIIKENALIEPDDANAIMDASAELAEGRMLPMLVDMRHVKDVTREARSVFQKRAPETGRAVAMVVPSMIARLIANLFLSMNLMPIPIRLFNSCEEAIEWLDNIQRQ